MMAERYVLQIYKYMCVKFSKWKVWRWQRVSKELK